MASKGRKKASLLSLTRERWIDDDLDKIIEELVQGSDRASAIIGSALAEHGLTDALSAHFRRMSAEDEEALFYKPTAPLQSFYARIMLGYAIGIYGGKFRDQLNTIRHIRNAFAHSIRPIAYSDKIVKKELDRLRDIAPKDVYMANAESHISALRGKFVANCADLRFALEAYAVKRVSHPNAGIFITFPDWPDDVPAPLLHRSI